MENLDHNYYLGWGTLALINSALAKSMNRGSGTWLVLSLFLGPLATLLLILTDRKK